MEDITQKLIKIIQPVKIGTRVSQNFGKPANDFLAKKYKEFGLVDANGNPFHNGIDFACPSGTPTFAVINGNTKSCGYNNTAGNYVVYETDTIQGEGFKYKLEFFNYHLKKVFVKSGSFVEMGQKIAETDNTGFSTGAHEHFGARLWVMKTMEGKDFFVKYQNDYMGYINPADLFVDRIGTLPVDKYYGRERNWLLEFAFRFANLPPKTIKMPFLMQRVKAGQYVHRKLINAGRKPPILTDRELNALIYGAWDIDSVLDPSMFALWAYFSNSEYMFKKQNGIKITTPLISGGI